MYTVKTCPKCSFTSANPFNECPVCGIIIEKYMRADRQKKENTAGNHENFETDVDAANDSPVKKFLSYANFRELLFSVDYDMHPINYGGRILIFLILQTS